MRTLIGLAAAAVASVVLTLASSGGVAYASFHCMRIHSVMAGFSGDGKVQYVELRMDSSGQVFLAGHTMVFRDAAGTVKATFTFPAGTFPFGASVANQGTGDSILIATHEFNVIATGGTADFEFTMTNTLGSAGGDPLHPVQGPNGKVEFAPDSVISCSFPAKLPPDSVAYGSATADTGFGTAAVMLPSPSDHRALRLGNLNGTPIDNSTEYSLNLVSSSTFTVVPANLATDMTTPRNNSEVVLKLTAPAPPFVGGIAEEPGVSALPSRADTTGGRSDTGLAAGGAALVLVAALGGGAWYVHRKRAA